MDWVNTSPLVKTYNLEEFWDLPEPPDHSKIELIAGILYLTPPPDYIHSKTVSKLNRLLSEYLIKSGDKGTLFVPRAAIWTSANTHLEPDLFYVSAETKEELDPKHFTTADLVIEVISPESAIYDRNTKADTYAALGIKELWLVNEAFEMLEIRHPTPSGSGVGKVYSKGDKLRSVVLSHLELDVGRVFS